MVVHFVVEVLYPLYILLVFRCVSIVLCMRRASSSALLTNKLKF